MGADLFGGDYMTINEYCQKCIWNCNRYAPGDEITESNGKYFAKVHNMNFVGNQKIVAEIEAKNYYEACRMVEAGQFTTVEDFGGRTEEGYMGATGSLIFFAFRRLYPFLKNV